MRKNKATVTNRVKRAVTSLVLLLIFLLPLGLGVQWIYQAVLKGDGRDVTSDYFNDSRYPVQTEPIHPCSEAVVTITFDDGWESAYTEGLPVLEKYGIKTTYYILGNTFDDPQYMSEAQVKSLQRAGHEIAAHTMSHPDLTSLTEDKLEWELSESNRILTEKFGPIHNFATPLGASNTSVVTHTQKYFRSLRNTAGDPETMGDNDINLCATLKPYDLNAYTVRDTTTSEDIQKQIDYVKQRGGWLILTYHQLGKHDSHWAIDQNKLDEQMKLVRDSGVRTATMQQTLDAIQQEKGSL